MERNPKKHAAKETAIFPGYSLPIGPPNIHTKKSATLIAMGKVKMITLRGVPLNCRNQAISLIEGF
jgi:hypothetical protein